MLLSLQIKNFKSYRDLSEFSMKSDRTEDLKDSLLTYADGNTQRKCLCSSVIYGPNAGGKSNIIKALDILKEIVLIGNIRRQELLLEYVPNVKADKDEPVYFAIEFFHEGIVFKYCLSICVGGFNSKSYNRYIDEEKLFVDNKLIYAREKQNLSLYHNKKFNSYLNTEIDGGTEALLQNSLVPTELFLTNGFKTLSKKLSQIILGWFENKLEIHEKLENEGMFPVFKSEMVVDTFCNQIAKESGITGSNIVYQKDENDKPRLKSIIGTNVIDADLFESYGTKRIVELMPIVLIALQSGTVLVIDELDVALHPKVVMNIINLFHNDEINVNGAQIIFNTHNPMYLNNSIFRRDEIKFVEKDESAHSSVIYKLSDFGTVGKRSVRNSTNYIKNYFTNKYGAILNIDYTDIFKHMLKGNTNGKKKN